MILEFGELEQYTQGERDKWRAWFDGHPAALESPVQAGGRFPAVWDLLDHIFLVEMRHSLRIQGLPVIDASGVTRGSLDALWLFAGSSRKRLLEAVRGLTAADAAAIREFALLNQIFRSTPRKLAFHVLIHEIRHFAQIAAAVRGAGHAPPGEHDLFFTRAVE